MMRRCALVRRQMAKKMKLTNFAARCDKEADAISSYAIRAYGSDFDSLDRIKKYRCASSFARALANEIGEDARIEIKTFL